MFAAFPEAYATIFSGFYWVFMLVLLALIARAVSLDFRSKIHSAAWRQTWDVVFCVSSTAATLLFGVGVGNAMMGVPLDSRGIYAAGFLHLLRPYPLTVGLLAVAMFVMHGAIFLHLKTTGELRERTYRWTRPGLHRVSTDVPGGDRGHLADDSRAHRARFSRIPGRGWWWRSIWRPSRSIPVALSRHRAGWAFIASCLTICAFVLLLGLALFPNLVTSNPHPENSLTIYNAASSEKTLGIMLVVAAIGMPFVITYTAIIYWVFRHRVPTGGTSY